MKKYKIAWLPGDGIGEEVSSEALRVLRAVGEVHDIEWQVEKCLVGSAAIEEKGHPYPEETHEICMSSDAVLFGAIGLPKYDQDPSAKVRPEQGLLEMRSRLGLFANIRPLQLYPSLVERSPLREDRLKKVDFICVRELTGGIYFGEPRGRSEDGNRAFDTCVYTRQEIERILRVGFQYAQKRKKHLTLVDKANVLATSRLWREIAGQLSVDYPEVQLDHMFIDNAVMQLVINPSQFDIVVTENMFGDIFSDVAGAIGGSLGLLPSASAGLHTAVFEPVHGSYPQAKGKGIANPVGTILSASMLLDHLGQTLAAKQVRLVVEKSIAEGVVTSDLIPESKYTTDQVGKWIAKRIQDMA